jgi:hypothetical protein
MIINGTEKQFSFLEGLVVDKIGLELVFSQLTSVRPYLYQLENLNRVIREAIIGDLF